MTSYPVVSAITTERVLRLCKEMETDENDVFVCSNPKSGTTWTMHLLYLLCSNADTSFKHISHMIPWLETKYLWDPEKQDICSRQLEVWKPLGRRLFKSHLHWQDMPHKGKGKFIYVVRDGQDSCFSLFQHMSNTIDHGFEGSFDEFFESWIGGKQFYGRWVDQVRSWLGPDGALSGDCADRVLVLTFEGLKADLPGEMRRIIGFLNLGLNQDQQEELIQRCLPLLSVENMRQNVTKFAPMEVKWKEGYSFVRKGVVGDHVAALSDEQKQRFKDCLNEVKPFEFFNPYEAKATDKATPGAFL